MPDKAWKVDARHFRKLWGWAVGLTFYYECDPREQDVCCLAFSLGPHVWALALERVQPHPCLTKPGKPKWWQGLLCIVVCLALQAFLWALDMRV